MKLTPTGIEEYSYDAKDGTKRSGFQFTFETEFVNDK
jgi:hypothetical protein